MSPLPWWAAAIALVGLVAIIGTLAFVAASRCP